MTRGVMGRVVLGVWLGYFTAAAAQLPPEVLVDKYLLQAQMLSEEKNHKGALEAMDRIVTLQKEHDLTLPEEFSFHYAQRALTADSVPAAIDSANRYLSVAGREGKFYREALELLVTAERKLREPSMNRDGTVLVASEIELQPQEVPPQSPRARKATAVQSKVDCKKWNTKKFYRRATVEDVTACLAAGANVKTRKRKGNVLLRAAIWSKDPKVIEALIEAGADPNARGRWDVTPLHWAVSHNKNPGVAKVLINAGVDLDAQTKKSKSTPLHFAADSASPELVKALVDAGANLMMRNSSGKTPLQVARKRHRKFLRDAWASLPDSQKAAQQAQARRQKTNSGPSFLDVAVGVAGGAAIATAGGGSDEAVEAGTVFAEGVISGQQPVGSSGGGVSAIPAVGDGSSSEFDTALRNLENSCGERYRSGFSAQDHGRFYCLDAFARHCALKKGHDQQQLDALRHDFEVLRSQGLESRCPYFGVLGGSYESGAEREAIDRAEKEARKARQEEKQRLEEQARQAAQEGKRRIEENNARVLASDCDCISKDERNSKLTCLDGFVGLTESTCNFRFRRR